MPSQTVCQPNMGQYLTQIGHRRIPQQASATKFTSPSDYARLSFDLPGKYRDLPGYYRISYRLQAGRGSWRLPSKNYRIVPLPPAYRPLPPSNTIYRVLPGVLENNPDRCPGPFKVFGGSVVRDASRPSGEQIKDVECRCTSTAGLATGAMDRAPSGWARTAGIVRCHSG